MAEYFNSSAQTVESESKFNQLEDSSDDDEYFDSLPPFENGSDSRSEKNSETTVFGNPSGVEHCVETDFQTERDVLEVEKSGSVFDFNASAQNDHHSSEESDNSGSTTDRAYMMEDQEGLVMVEMIDNICDKDTVKMIKMFRDRDYSALNSDADLLIAKCRMLYKRDYHCEEIDNSGGVLCEHYPARLIVPVAKKSSGKSTGRLDRATFDPETFTEETRESNSSRLRKRFVTPVIMFDKKFICRAATITVRKTAAFETALQPPDPQAENVDDGHIVRFAKNICRTPRLNSTLQAAAQVMDPDSIKTLRENDARILRDLKVQYICDLMVEDRKKFNGLSLSSSEKINPEIYRDCNIEQMPYPGCGFFTSYHNANRNPEGLIFDWERSEADAVLKLTEDPSENFPDIEWDKYKEWDLIELTKNYMKILLLYLAKSTGGLLVHCVSGWDRTPLFISILRVSLWADGVIHQSLNYKDMAYLTLTYDWYLFGHNLRNRLEKKEEIMHFCFKFLPYIVDDEFSLTRIFHKLPIEQRENHSLPDFRPRVRTVINELCTYVLNIYDEHLSCML